MKRKDLEVVVDSSLFSETKRIRMSMDGEEAPPPPPPPPVILEEEAVMSYSPAFEEQLQVDGLPQGVLLRSGLENNRVDEMPIDPIEIHEREETGAEEEPMEVEDETEREAGLLLLQRQGRTAPVMWSGCEERTWILLRREGPVYPAAAMSSTAAAAAAKLHCYVPADRNGVSSRLC